MKLVRLALGAGLAIGAGSALAQALSVQPGEWDIAATVTSVDMPNAPPGLSAAMIGKTKHITHCITPEEASRGPQDMMKSDKSCKFTRYSVTGGKLSSEMVCQQGGSTMTATSTGTFTPTSFTSSGRSVMTGGAMKMTLNATTVGKRIGECKK